MKKLSQILLGSAALTLAIVVVAYLLVSPTPKAEAIGGLDESVFKYATSSNAYVGRDLPTTGTIVTSLSSGRTYLEITNISGATSTASTVYCAVGANPSRYKGIAIIASTTRIWTREHIPVGPMKCIADNASSTITIIER